MNKYIIYLKAFMAGSFISMLFHIAGRALTGYLGILDVSITSMYWMPLLWGSWNVGYVALKKNNVLGLNENKGISIIGLLLGFVVSLVIVFVEKAALPGTSQTVNFWTPFLTMPVIYVLLWRYVVKYFNKNIMEIYEN